MGVYTFTTGGDYTSAVFSNVDRFDFLSDSASGQLVLLNASQFGPGRTSDTLALNAGGRWSLGVFVGPNESFSAAGWDVTAFGGTLGMIGQPGGDVSITGSRGRDSVSVRASSVYAPTDDAIVRTGLGDDGISADPLALSTGDVFDGGAGYDTFSLFADTEITAVDLRGVTFTSIERLYLSAGEDSNRTSTFSFDAEQLDDVRVLTTFALQTYIRVYGSDVDLTDLDRGQTNGNYTPIIFGDGAGTNLLIGSHGQDSFFGAPSAPNRIVSNGGLDYMQGGDMDDVFVLSDPSADFDSILGQGGFDTIEIATAVAGGSFALDYYSVGQIERIQFTGTAPAEVRMTESGRLFEGALVSVVGGPGANTLRVNSLHANGDPADSRLIDVSGITFSSWSTADKVILQLAYSGKVIGSSVADTIYATPGADTLDGGGGADRMMGGSGSDTYTVDQAGDTVVELSDGGTDTVFAKASYALAAGQSVETLQLDMSTVAQPLNLTGNEIGNVLVGNAGANVLNGGGAADLMQGGSGNDSYVVDNIGDVVRENANAGVDTVVTTVSYALGAGQHVETLQLSGSTGSQALNLTGNELANALIGNAGTNALQGLAGADVLQGGGGRDIIVPGNDAMADTIRFNAISDSTGSNRDQLLSVDVNNEDKLDFAVRPTVFLGTVTTGALNNGANFNIEIANAVNGLLNAGGAVEAVVFDPNSGGLNQAGFSYLVVDANNDGSYTANADYLVELVNLTGALEITDFI